MRVSESKGLGGKYPFTLPPKIEVVLGDLEPSFYERKMKTFAKLLSNKMKQLLALLKDDKKLTKTGL